MHPTKIDRCNLKKKINKGLNYNFVKQLTQQNVHSKIGETREVGQKNKHYKENRYKRSSR